MARPLRIEYEGAVYHITTRGNARQRIYFSDVDKTAFLRIFAEVVARFGWICHAYCLMPNHYHLLIETPDANLSRGMRHLNGVFTQWSNHHNRRTGHLFQGRFKSILVQRESYLLEVSRYVVLNPVRANLARAARDWKWSSYRATAGQEAIPDYLTVSWILSHFGDVASDAVKAYRSFVRKGREVRVWEELRRGTLLGTEHFVEQMVPLLKEQAECIEIPRSQRMAGRPPLDILFEGVEDKASRNERIYQAVHLHGYRLREVADHLGLYYTTISTIAKRVAEKHQE